MKRILSFLLALTMLLSLLTGCGGGAPVQAAPETEAVMAEAAETAEAVTEAPTTEPTLSAEELLYDSLPERMKQAVDLGILEVDMLADPERICRGLEAAQMIQNVRLLKRGEEAVILSQVADSDYADIDVTRYWLALMIFISEVEAFCDPKHDTLAENLADPPQWDSPEGDSYLGAHQAGQNVTENAAVYGAYFKNWYDPDEVITHGFWSCYPDFQECIGEVNKTDDWVEYVDYGDSTPVYWCAMSFDRVTGEKIWGPDEDGNLNPRRTLTVQEVAETVLRYYNCIPPEAEMYAYEEVPEYDHSIITDALLTRETDLPEASCQNLPSQWKGVLMRDLLNWNRDGDAKTDMMIYEQEIQLIKDAGFNYVKILFDFEYYGKDHNDFNFISLKKPQQGSMNETHLKELDQIIAWCMERDIHVNLCSSETGMVGFPENMIPPTVFTKSKYAQPLAEQWQVLARRYADIPNRYLSFTLIDADEIFQEMHYEAFLTPVVDAIREVSADRCIIADVFGKYTGQSMAKLGVALSSAACWPEELLIKPREARSMVDNRCETMTWPYEKGSMVYDGEAAMVNRLWQFSAPDDVAATAQQYGVGYMVSHWAPYVETGNSVRRERFNDTMLKAYLEDMTQTMEGRGYGWCYGNWFSFVGFGAAYPAIRSTTYTKLNNAPLYVDDEVFGWFREINGVA